MNHWGWGGLREKPIGDPNLASDSGQRCSFDSAIWARGRGLKSFPRGERKKHKFDTPKKQLVSCFFRASLETVRVR